MFYKNRNKFLNQEGTHHIIGAPGLRGVRGHAALDREAPEGWLKGRVGLEDLEFMEHSMSGQTPAFHSGLQGPLLRVLNELGNPA